MDQAHLIGAMDQVMRRLGGTARVWRADRLTTVITPGTRDVQPTFAPVAKHYGAIVEPCPPRRGKRKGSVESSVKFVSGQWWRTMSERTPAATDPLLRVPGTMDPQMGPTNAIRGSVNERTDNLQ